jgi:hypothetical protein
MTSHLVLCISHAVGHGMGATYKENIKSMEGVV